MQILKSYRLSERVTLRPGDSVKISKGPYFQKNDGSKRKMGFSGKGIIVRIEKSPKASKTPGDIVLTVREIGKTGLLWGYQHCRITGDDVRIYPSVISRPYKVTKPRKPYDFIEVPLY